MIDIFQRNQFFAINLNDYTSLGI